MPTTSASPVQGLSTDESDPSNYTVYFAGFDGRQLPVQQIGNQTSGAVYLQPLTSANSAAVQSRRWRPEGPRWVDVSHPGLVRH